MRVMIRLRPALELVMATLDPAAETPPAAEIAGRLPGCVLDEDYLPVPVPAATGGPRRGRYSFAPDQAGLLVRGDLADDDADVRLARVLSSRTDVVGVYADPVISTCDVCGGDGPSGTWRDVADRLRQEDLKQAGLTGEGVPVAVVDTGINAAHLADRLDRQVTLDAGRSWRPAGVSGDPGEFEVGHGTMTAFDALIAAPEATLLDLPLLRSQRPGGSAMDGLLSDAVAAYEHLRGVLEEAGALVVTNSWGSFSPEWDFPPGHPGNYSDNPEHPFNLSVGGLSEAGADILFAAGNCGRDCPDSRCAFDERPITGANSHPDVLSIAGVDVDGVRAGYSSQGPGRLADRKPDVSAAAHFDGSGALGDGSPDSGTSAACPVAAGVLAAVRTRWPASAISTDQLRTLIRRTADDQGAAGFDYDYGYGTIDVRGVLNALKRRAAA